MDAVIAPLLDLVDSILEPSGVDPEEQQREAFVLLSEALRPEGLRSATRQLFVQRVLGKGIVERAATLVQHGSLALATVTCHFLALFCFNCGDAARATLTVFEACASRFACKLNSLNWECTELLEAATVLCMNIAALCPSGHSRLLSLVKPVWLQILHAPRASEQLRYNTILLLANLSVTVGDDLQLLGVAEALLEFVLQVPEEHHRGVAESVIIYLRGHYKNEVMDTLMYAGVVDKYCVPIMQHTLQGRRFRGMYPILVYSARLFFVLTRCREYAELLVRNGQVVPLLLQSARHQEDSLGLQIESDCEGRSLALEALSKCFGFGLWRPLDASGQEFVAQDLPKLLAEDHTDIRIAAARLWAYMHPEEVAAYFLVGARLERKSQIPQNLWREKVLSFILPFVAKEEHTVVESRTGKHMLYWIAKRNAAMFVRRPEQHA